MFSTYQANNISIFCWGPLFVYCRWDRGHSFSSHRGQARVLMEEAKFPSRASGRATKRRVWRPKSGLWFVRPKQTVHVLSTMFDFPRFVFKENLSLLECFSLGGLSKGINCKSIAMVELESKNPSLLYCRWLWGRAMSRGYPVYHITRS